VELAGRLGAERSVPISPAMLCVWLKQRGMTHKNVWPAPSASGFCEAI
jgi:hypothetical protein